MKNPIVPKSEKSAKAVVVIFKCGLISVKPSMAKTKNAIATSSAPMTTFTIQWALVGPKSLFKIFIQKAKMGVI